MVGGEGLWNVHVHVDDVGAAIEAGIAAGRPHRVRVTHFAEQIEERSRRRAPEPQGGPGHRRGGRRARVWPRLFEEAGAVVVRGGPGDRPSTGQLLDAIRACGADEVVVLPNDDDTIRAAQVAASTAETDHGIRVAVLPTHAQVQGLAALAVHEPGRSFDQDVLEMTATARHARQGAVTVAAKQAITMAGPCEPGDVLGAIGGDFVVVGSDLEEVAADVLGRLLGSGGELVTLVSGADDADGALAAGLQRAGWRRTTPLSTSWCTTGGRSATRCWSPSSRASGRGEAVISLDSPVETVLGAAKGKKVQSRNEGIVDRLGLRTVGDLLHHFPRRYLETGILSALDELREGQLLTVVGEIASSESQDLQGPAHQPDGLPAGGRAPHRRALAADGLLRAEPQDRPTWNERRLQRGAPRHLHGQGRAVPRRVAAHQPAAGAVRHAATRTEARAVAGVDQARSTRSTRSPRASSPGTSRRRSASRGRSSRSCPSCCPTSVRKEYDVLDARTALDWIHAPETRGQITRAQHRYRFEEALVTQLVLARRRRTIRRWARGRAPATRAGCSRRSTPGCRSSSPPGRSRSAPRSTTTSPSRTR